jgi:hypothetical protein
MLCVGIAAAPPALSVSTGPSGSSATNSGTVAFAEPVGNRAANYISPMASPQYIGTTSDQGLCALLWQPLYWFENNGTSPVSNLNPALSIGDLPVYSDNNHMVTIKLKQYVWSDGRRRGVPELHGGCRVVGVPQAYLDREEFHLFADADVVLGGLMWRSGW